MRIAIEGCCHGELDKIYETVAELEKQNRFKIDLLIICGDFQSVRNFDDLQALAAPIKYQQLNTFYKYYSREVTAPVLTVFIGGNHEASNYLQELPYGGWVAPNIYYMGYAGVIQIGGLRIGGISGIFKGHDYNRGHHETPPYTDDTKRSVYHIRSLEVFRLKQISRHVDVFFSHDWPQGIYHHGDVARLIKTKPFFQKEIQENKLGSSPLADLLTHLQPSYWFAAHLHVKFAAHVQHQPKSETEPAKCTKFLALDKCLPRRQFLQVLWIPHNSNEDLKIKLDPEWLTILQNTDHLLNLTFSSRYMPGPGCGSRFDFRVTDSEMEDMLKTFGGDVTLPENFVHTSSPLTGNPAAAARQRRQPLAIQINPQTTLLCSMLNITDPNAKFMGKTSHQLLDESFIREDKREDDDDSGEDVIYENNDDEMPSTVDSSMDASTGTVSMSMSSSKCDSFMTANETLDGSSLGCSKPHFLVTSTPARGGFISSPHALEVDDNDEELLSILSAQKSNSCGKSNQLSSSPVNHRNSPITAHHANTIERSAPPQKVTSNQKFQDSANESRDNLQDTSRAGLSSLDQDINSSLLNHHPVPLKKERSSFGMSGLCLDTEELATVAQTESSTKKRDSIENSVSSKTSFLDTTADGSVVKKLKRRNVSMYSESVE